MNEMVMKTEVASGLLAGKTAIVTGSTSGIGLGIARAFANAGANVVLNGFGDEREIEVTRANLAKETGVSVAYDKANLAKPEEISAMIERMTAAFGQIDI